MNFRFIRNSYAAVLLLWWGVAGVGGAAAEVLRVPSQYGLQAALDAAEEGDVVEIASGTYTASGTPFLILNKHQAFTVRAAPGASVTLDGGGSSRILRFRNLNPSQGRPVVFERLTFANGLSEMDQSGSVTIDGAVATFVECTFRDHTGRSPSTGSGALHVFADSKVFVVDSLWQDNVSDKAGAGLLVRNSTVWVHNSRFVNNRTNIPNHRLTAAGGAANVGSTGPNFATLRLSNTRLEGNESGYTGGGVFLIGEYANPIAVPRAVADVANCSFVDNAVEPHPTVPLTNPTEGGGFHVENQAHARIYNSRFFGNQGRLGGAVSTYRASVEVHDSVFIGNQSPGTGGAFKTNSNDTNNATTGNGAFNRPSGRITVSHSLIHGPQPGPPPANPGDFGGIFAAGDNNRAYGNGTVQPMGTIAENRATLVVDNVIFSDLGAVAEAEPQSGIGGAVLANLADLSIRESLFIDCDAFGPGNNPQGGAVMSIGDSALLIEDSTFANNTAFRGGAVNAQGAEATVTDNRFFANEVSPGVSEPASQSFGAALYTGPYFDNARDIELSVSGNVSENTFSDNDGLPIYDADNEDEPINEVLYSQNTIYSTIFGDSVYRDPVAGGPMNTSELNSLVVMRSSAPNTVKAPTSSNAAMGSKPTLGELKAAPRKIIPVTAAGDPELETKAYLAYAWSGGSASLDGQGLGGSETGIEFDVTPGSHTLHVDGLPFSVDVADVPAPAATFTASPPVIGDGGSSTLSWSVDEGTLIEVAIDQDADLVSAAASGSVVVSPQQTTTYRLFVITEEGGVVEEVTVGVGAGAELIFSDGFESGNTSSWNG